ncbi:MAG: SurA N-terminal domain-containing protein [Bacteroidales bacterium]|nr:SurA N-terminal domain-containing protein [Bacteroidales bacterium]
MAIIGTIRKHSALAVIIVGVAIAAFVIGDFGAGRSKPTTDIGAVNGEDIAYMDFNSKVEENLEFQRENTGDDKISEETSYQVRQSVWNTMIRNLVIGNELEELGMGVSPEELFEQVQGKNPHRYILQYFKDPNSGQYDPAIVLNYLRNLDQMEPKARTQWLQFEKAIKEDRLETKFNNLISKSYYMPKPLLRKQHEQQNKSLNIRYVSPGFYVIPDSAVVLTDADYARFYDKNKAYFQNEEPVVELDYVMFEVKPSAKDREDIAEDVSKMFADFEKINDPMTFVNANSDQKFDTGYINRGILVKGLDSLLFSSPVDAVIPPFQEENAWFMAKVMGKEERPDSMQGAQLLITWAGLGINDSVTRTQQQAKRTTDSLVAILKANPARFEEITKSISDYPTAKDDGGLLPWFPDGNENVSPFFDAGVTMKPNDVKIVETRLGYSIFKLSEKSPDKQKVKAAILQRNIDPSNQTFQDTYTRASMFAGTYKNPEAFDTGAVASGVFKRQAANVKPMDNTVQGLKSARNMVRWAFADPTEIGEVSPVFDLQGVYVVALLKDRSPAGVQPLDKLKERIEPSVKNMKKIELMAGQITEAMKRTADLNEFASTFNAKVDTATVTFTGMNRSTIARENDVLGQLFSLPSGQLQGPFQGNFGVYVVVVDNVVEAPSKEDFTYEQRMDFQGWNNRVSNSLFDALKKQATIEDHREMFY